MLILPHKCVAMEAASSHAVEDLMCHTSESDAEDEFENPTSKAPCLLFTRQLFLIHVIFREHDTKKCEADGSSERIFLQQKVDKNDPLSS